jgi:hypothetical protein
LLKPQWLFSPPAGRYFPFYCFGFGSEAAKTKAKEGSFLAAAVGVDA